MSIFPFKKRGQKPRTAGQRPRTPGEQPRTQGQQRQAAPGSPDGASLATFGGLGEEDVHALYRLAPIKLLAEGEALVPPNAESSSPMYIVTGGSVDLAALLPGGKLNLAVLTKGTCLDLHSLSRDNGVAYQADAREPTTLIELNKDQLSTLSPGTSLFVARQLAATSAMVLATLGARCAALSRANTELTRSLRGFRAERLAMSRASTVARVVESIPKLPLHTTELMHKLFAPNAHGTEIVELIKNDPPLAGLVLKTVNSPYFSLPTKVADYYRAFLFLGTNNVYQLILDAGMRNVLPQSPEAEEIQTHSYLVSIFIHDIAVAARLQQQVCSTIGLLHDIGKTVGLVLRTTQPELAPFVHLLDESELGASLLKRWAVPDEVCAVIERQQEPGFLPPEGIDAEYRKETAALYLAHLCAEFATGGEPTSTSTAYLPAYLSLLGVQEPDHVAFYRQRLLPKMAKQTTRLPQRVRELLAQNEAQDDVQG